MKRHSVPIFLLLGACGHGENTEAPRVSLEELMDPITCAECHPEHFDDWASSLHAYASDDPLFLAMNRRGQREGAIGDFCVQCHAPMAVRNGLTSDGLNLDLVPQKFKGVTCYFCHSVDGVEGTHNNPLHLADDGVLRGQIGDPRPSSAHGAAYSPLLDRDRLESSQLCGSCHDIVNGHGTHIERTFEEWQTSVFSQATGGATCSQCHMNQSKELERISVQVGMPLRRRHSHLFPGVDLPLTFPKVERLRQETQAFLDTTLQSAVCVVSAGDTAAIQVILDNVAAGHRWPSGSAQDRRAWVEVSAYSGTEIVYQSGAVPAGTAATELDDPDFWLMRDCLLDEEDREVHMFWEAKGFDSNLLPAPVTFDPTDPRFYQTHVFQRYPRGSGMIPYPDRVRVRVYLEAFAQEVFDDLVESGDLADTDAYTVADLRSRLASYQIGADLEWTEATANETFLDRGIPVSCASSTNLKGGAGKVPASNRTRCFP